MSEMKAPDSVAELVSRYEYNHDSYLSPQYNEARLRQEFLNPFFSALGWDMDNTQGYAEAYKEVIHEDSIAVEGRKKAPDYCFRIGGVRKFFVEAKKPRINVRAVSDPAYQLRRYAWSSKLPVSILTNFEDFVVYDCRAKPVKPLRARDPRAAAAAGVLLHVGYGEYVDRWEEIASVFSREAIPKGSFDKYVASRRAGHIPVDSHFLDEMNEWRVRLAQDIFRNNPDISTEQLQDVVQKTIDRIVFLRICEDRQIEEFGQLKATKGSYPALCQIFLRADERYDSGLFHFAAERSNPGPIDTFSLNLRISTNVLNSIIRSLYDPSPYEFSVFPHDLLGQVYEQFLGKVIVRAGKKQVGIEDKPEVRKAGGVYYTPTHIVDYIVKRTVGELTESRKPEDVASLRVLDPACGSGSFLLGAYDFLLQWHMRWYVNDGPDHHTDRVYESDIGKWFLTTEEKRRILVDNIYGVDIDPQAVEVTRLSLLLKLLEGENEATIDEYKRHHRRKALPDLASNIKCGNSLISSDFYVSEIAKSLNEDELRRINALDWDVEFATVMRSGGFDSVIGNPPYIRIQHMKQWSPVEVERYREQYRSASKGNYDIYAVFVERSLKLLGTSGRLGFILPNKFFNAEYGEPLRDLIAEGEHLSEVVHFGDQQIFADATTYTCLMFLTNQGSKSCQVAKVKDLADWLSDGTATRGTIGRERITKSPWNFVVGPDASLYERLTDMPHKLAVVADIFVGLQTSADDVFIMELVDEDVSTSTLRSEALGEQWVLENELLHPLMSGQDLGRYSQPPARRVILFPYRVADGSATLISLDSLSTGYPMTAKYLLANQRRLENRERGKFNGPSWHRFGRTQNLAVQSTQKLCVPRLVDSLVASYDEDGSWFLDNVDVGGITLKESLHGHGLLYLLGLINSKLLRWYFPHVSAPFRGGYLSANKQFLGQLPIRVLDLREPRDAEDHAEIVEVAGRISKLMSGLSEASTEGERTSLKRQVDALDHRLDETVYRLYELTSDEIRMVEERT